MVTVMVRVARTSIPIVAVNIHMGTLVMITISGVVINSRLAMPIMVSTDTEATIKSTYFKNNFQDLRFSIKILS